MDVPTRPAAPWWLGIAAPNVLFVAFGALTVLSFAVGVLGVLFVLVVPLLLFVGVVSLYCLYRDVRLVALADTDWKPAAWTYVAGGAVPLWILVVTAGALGGTLDPGSVLFGGVISVPLSTVVSGPVYLWRRYRRFGTLGT